MASEQVPEVAARLVFAGGESSRARARVIERSAAWRRRAALMQLGWWLLVPLVFWIPPHLPWVLLVLAIGALRALNRLREHRTLVSLHGACPRCGTEQDFGETGRMKQPHTVRCAGCQWDLHAVVPVPGAAA